MTTLLPSEQLAQTPDRLLDALIDRLDLKNDAALARVLGTSPPVISNLRHRRLPLGPTLLLQMLETADLGIRDLLELVTRQTSIAPTVASRRSPAARTQEQIGITRRYDKKALSYGVIVAIRRNGVAFEKYFSENRYGGPRETMKLAQAWRDAIIAAYPAMSFAQFCDIVRATNTSGISGVRHAVTRPRNKKGEVIGCYASWCADIPLGNGKYRYRSFSVEKYGDDGARQRAIEARQEGLRDLEALLPNPRRQPHPVSTADDLMQLQAVLRAEEEQHLRRLAEREANRQRVLQRAADRQAQAQAAEQKALQITNRSGEPYISRRDAKGSAGASWRVSIKRLGKRYEKGFPDSTNGGTAGALEAAKAWRDQTFQALPVVSKAQMARNLPTANVSGVTGVYRSTTMSGGQIKDIWVAVEPRLQGRRRRSKQIRIDKYGEQQALEMAIQAREAFVSELADIPHLPKHTAKQMMNKMMNGFNAPLVGKKNQEHARPSGETKTNEGRRRGRPFH